MECPLLWQILYYVWVMLHATSWVWAGLPKKGLSPPIIEGRPHTQRVVTEFKLSMKMLTFIDTPSQRL